MKNTTEQIAEILYRELRKQAEENTGFVGEYQMKIDDKTTLDGHFDLVAAANALFAELK